MKLLPLGNDTSALTKRLQDTEGYLESYSHGRKLQIYFVGYFPITGVTSDILGFAQPMPQYIQAIENDQERENEIRSLRTRR
jgi:hypothetical protein